MGKKRVGAGLAVNGELEPRGERFTPRVLEVNFSRGHGYLTAQERGSVADKALEVYLNDHLAGSEAALAGIERHLREDAGGLGAARLAHLLPEIRKDQALLKKLISRIGGEESAAKKAGAWLAEKASRLKLGGKAESNPLRLVEAFEALALGVHGKGLLWRLMNALYRDDARFSDVDFGELERRAARQYDEVEALRLEAARLAFSSP